MIRWPPRTLLAALLLLGFALLAPATRADTGAGGAYNVEIVIFRAATVPGGEDLSAPPEGRGFDSGSSNGTAPRVILLRTVDQYQMGGLAARLRSSGAHVLGHAAWTQSATAWGAHVPLDLADVGIHVPDLSGSIYLERGQFLHLGFDLTVGSAPGYRLRELRRIKYNEKQYFDHPAFGVLALVTPVVH